MQPIKFAKNLFLSGLIAASITSVAHADVTVPNTFSAGQAAKASEVNANFTALADAINGLTARLDAIDAANAQPLVEKLKGRRFEVKIIKTAVNSDPGASYTSVETAQGYGLITLNANGTYQYSYQYEQGTLPIVYGNEVTARELNLWGNGIDEDGDGVGDGEMETGDWTVTANNSLQLNRAPEADFPAYYFRLTPSGEVFVAQEYLGLATANHYRSMLFVGVMLK